MKFEVSDDAIITVAGIQMTAAALEFSLLKPDERVLFSVKREESPDGVENRAKLTFTQYRTPETAAKFFTEERKFVPIDETATAALQAESEGMPPLRDAGY